MAEAPRRINRIAEARIFFARVGRGEEKIKERRREGGKEKEEERWEGGKEGQFHKVPVVVKVSLYSSGLANKMSTCGGHGAAMPPRPFNYPENTCWCCHLPYPPPFIPPPPSNCPPNFTPNVYEDGVMRSPSGHICGIMWGELRGPNAHLARFKDVAIGPGHPLAEGMDPRGFIPSAARSPSPPRPLLVPLPPPVCAAPKRPVSTDAPEESAAASPPPPPAAPAARS